MKEIFNEICIKNYKLEFIIFSVIFIIIIALSMLITYNIIAKGKVGDE